MQSGSVSRQELELGGASDGYASATVELELRSARQKFDRSPPNRLANISRYK
jgi:hypothetical protein